LCRFSAFCPFNSVDNREVVSHESLQDVNHLHWKLLKSPKNQKLSRLFLSIAQREEKSLSISSRAFLSDFSLVCRRFSANPLAVGELKKHKRNHLCDFSACFVERSRERAGKTMAKAKIFVRKLEKWGATRERPRRFISVGSEFL
jgi:hypothetical protein